MALVLAAAVGHGAAEHGHLLEVDLDLYTRVVVDVRLQVCKKENVMKLSLQVDVSCDHQSV